MQSSLCSGGIFIPPWACLQNGLENAKQREVGLMSFLKRLFGGSSGGKRMAPAPDQYFDADLAPDAPVFVVGDLHGCMRQMEDLQSQMRVFDGDAHQVYVGDYVDRGEHSADVLRHLYARRDDPTITCLTGNHEDMLLGFLDQPMVKGPRWLRYGITTSSSEAEFEEKASALYDAMGEDMVQWLRDLPTKWESGNVVVVHAGADPALPMTLQAEKTLKWGHPDFFRLARTDDTWVVHGHTIVEQANATLGRIAVDTGAYATGRLTAAYVAPDGLHFLHAG